MASAPQPEANGRDDVAGSLRELAERIEQLQLEVRRLAPVLPKAQEDWGAPAPAPAPASYAWLSSLESPVRRRPTVPRLLLEVLFLAGVAVAAALAELDAPAIAGVMAGAWVLVALIEWASALAARRRAEILLRPPPEPPQPLPADPAWYVPPVEQTLLEGGSSTDAATDVTRLPPTPPADVETTADRPGA